MRSLLRPSNLNSIGTARAARTLTLNPSPRAKSMASGGSSVLPPKVSPANFCIRATLVVVLSPPTAGFLTTAATPPAKSEKLNGPQPSSKLMVSQVTGGRGGAGVPGMGVGPSPVPQPATRISGSRRPVRNDWHIEAMGCMGSFSGLSVLCLSSAGLYEATGVTTAVRRSGATAQPPFTARPSKRGPSPLPSPPAAAWHHWVDPGTSRRPRR